MNMKELVNKYLPEFIFNDASNRNKAEMVKLHKMCLINHQFLIYQKRNINNDALFISYEYDFKINNICEMFTNKDNHFAFNKKNITENNLAPLFNLKKQIADDAKLCWLILLCSANAYLSLLFKNISYRLSI